MARSYANILTSIWRDPAFRVLPGEAQRCYLMLVTQPDISAAGTLALTVGRWSGLASDTTPDDIRRALATLSDTRHIVMDDQEEELLVRSFVRHDNGWRNSKRRPAILDAARDTRSPQIRQALATEFRRLGLPTAGLTGPLGPDPDADSPSDSPSDHDSVDNTSHEAFSQVEGLSHSPSDSTSDSDRVVVTKGEYLRPPNPQPPTPNPCTAEAAEQPEPSTVTPEGEGARSKTDVVTQVRGIRPEWSARSIERTLRHPDVTDRPWPLVVGAMLAVAHDPASQAPGRLRHDGPWWHTAARSAGRDAAAALPPPCGQCGPNRLIELADGRAARCPNCHPLATTGGAA